MIKDLIAYQNVDAKLRKIESELAQSPCRKKAISAKNYILNTPETVNKLDDRALQLSNAYEELLRQQASLIEQQKELSQAMEKAEDGKEMAFLIKKADELISAIKQVSSTCAKVNEDLQKVIKEYSSVRATNKSAQAQYAEATEEYEKLKESFKDERESIQKELEALKSKVDPILMEKYLKKRQNKMFPIVYEVTGEACGSCLMELSMLEKNKLKNGEIIECEQCGKLLYKLN